MQDNIFASYLFALDAKELSYSNLIQVIKSKTAQVILRSRVHSW